MPVKKTYCEVQQMIGGLNMLLLGLCLEDTDRDKFVAIEIVAQSNGDQNQIATLRAKLESLGMSFFSDATEDSIALPLVAGLEELPRELVPHSKFMSTASFPRVVYFQAASHKYSVNLVDADRRVLVAMFRLNNQDDLKLVVASIFHAAWQACAYEDPPAVSREDVWNEVLKQSEDENLFLAGVITIGGVTRSLNFTVYVDWEMGLIETSSKASNPDEHDWYYTWGSVTAIARDVAYAKQVPMGKVVLPEDHASAALLN